MTTTKKVFAYVGGGAIVLWLLVLFVALHNTAAISGRIGIRSTLLVVSISLAVAAVTLLVAMRSAFADIATPTMRRLGRAFVWAIVVVFAVVSMLFIWLVIMRIDAAGRSLGNSEMNVLFSQYAVSLTGFATDYLHGYKQCTNYVQTKQGKWNWPKGLPWSLFFSPKWWSPDLTDRINNPTYKPLQ